MVILLLWLILIKILLFPTTCLTFLSLIESLHSNRKRKFQCSIGFGNIILRKPLVTFLIERNDKIVFYSSLTFLPIKQDLTRTTVSKGANDLTRPIGIVLAFGKDHVIILVGDVHDKIIKEG